MSLITMHRASRTVQTVVPRTIAYRPLPAMARASFPLRGTCDTCARTDVPCTPRRDASFILGSSARTMVCAHCTMTGA